MKFRDSVTVEEKTITTLLMLGIELPASIVVARGQFHKPDDVPGPWYCQASAGDRWVLARNDWKWRRTVHDQPYQVDYFTLWVKLDETKARQWIRDVRNRLK